MLEVKEEISSGKHNLQSLTVTDSSVLSRDLFVFGGSAQ